MSFPRYDEYKDSGVEWLGEVPAHWRLTPLKWLADIQNGADHKPIEQDDGYPVYGSGGVFAFASDYLYDGESVLLGRKGTIDKPLYVSGRFWTVDTMYWTKIARDANPRFVYYAATTIPFDYYSTSTALPSMTKGTLGMHFVAAPPPPEQTAIAAFLDRETAKIDDLVAEQQNLIALLKEKRQALISHAVTKGLNPNAPMKDSGVEWLGEVPAHWDFGPLKRFAGVIDCKHHTVQFLDDGLPIVSIRELRDDRIDLSNAKLTSVEEWTFLREGRAPVRGDLIFCRNASVGAVGIVDGEQDFCMGQDVCLIRPKVVSRFSYYQMTSSAVRNQIEAFLVGATIRRANVEEIRSLWITWPPRDEQLDIADYLAKETEKFDALIAEAESSITLLQERRTALISAAVTGKIDIQPKSNDSTATINSTP